MTPAAQPGASQQAVVEAALVLLERMGLSPADLVAPPRDRAVVPTFAEYVPMVSAAVSAGTRRAYGSYWNRIVDQWGERRLDEPTPSEIRQLMTWVKTYVVARRNARGGRSAQERLVAALRCVYRRAVEDGETACRRGGALALRPQDLDPDQCLVLLREKGETVRWQPVSPTLMTRLVLHGQERHAPWWR